MQVNKGSSVVFRLFFFFFAVAIEAALSYSESAVELLKRKKLRRDDLFQYLASQNVVISQRQINMILYKEF